MKPNAKPFRANPYPVPRIHRDTIRRELKRLCELGVIEEIEGSQWAAPSFFIPKPDGTGRFLTNFHGLNSQIERKPYPRCLRSRTFFSKWRDFRTPPHLT